jgi:predicted nucleic acid-binding protein
MQLEQQNIVTTSLVFAELLQGAKNKQEIKILEEYFSILENLEQKNTWIEAGKFSQENKLISFGVGLPDATLLVIAKNTKSTIWTRDKKLKKIMEKLHIGVFP